MEFDHIILPNPPDTRGQGAGVQRCARGVEWGLRGQSALDRLSPSKASFADRGELGLAGSVNRLSPGTRVATSRVEGKRQANQAIDARQASTNQDDTNHQEASVGIHDLTLALSPKALVLTAGTSS